MIKLILVGSGKIFLGFLDACLSNNGIKVVGCINIHKDTESKKYVEGEISKRGISTIALDLKILREADCVCAISCNYIFPKEIVESVDIVNVHFGILPKYRGNSANLWAIMNGESQVGFSLHKMTEELDAGDIFYIGKINMDENQTYSDVYDVLLNEMYSNLPSILVDIANGRMKGSKQNENYVYCTLFSRSMGDIIDYNVNSEYIYRLYKCMAKPRGTGIHFFKNGIEYEAGKVILGKSRGVDDYIGIPGKIVNVVRNEIWVKTQDNVVIYSDIQKNSKDINVADEFKNGQLLLKK